MMVVGQEKGAASSRASEEHHAPAAPEIRPIDRVAVARICSGQVVVDLATAVKELVENSLDAGATQVEVKLRDWGVDSIEVSDNGQGVSPENYQALTLKYHTSKITGFADLKSVSSFGFRGEALSSLCEISGKFEVTTKTKGQSTGTKLMYDRAGKLASQEPVARQPGTTVSITNLFEPLPVRRAEFKRTVSKQSARLLRVLQAYAVVSVGVRITCVNFKGPKATRQQLLSTQASRNMRENIINIFGASFASTLSPVEVVMTADDRDNGASGGSEESKSGIPAGAAGEDLQPAQDGGKKEQRITGLVSRAGEGVGRSDNDRQFFFLNKRPVDLPRVTRVVNDVWRQYETKHKPAAILNFQAPSGSFDVNVTPDKREVFLVGEAELLERLKESLHRLWESANASRTFDVSLSQGSSNQPSRAVLGSARARDGERVGDDVVVPLSASAVVAAADGVEPCTSADPESEMASQEDAGLRPSSTDDIHGSGLEETPRMVVKDENESVRTSLTGSSDTDSTPLTTASRPPPASWDKSKRQHVANRLAAFAASSAAPSASGGVNAVGAARGTSTGSLDCCVPARPRGSSSAGGGRGLITRLLSKPTSCDATSTDMGHEGCTCQQEGTEDAAPYGKRSAESAFGPPVLEREGETPVTEQVKRSRGDELKGSAESVTQLEGEGCVMEDVSDEGYELRRGQSEGDDAAESPDDLSDGHVELERIRTPSNENRDHKFRFDVQRALRRGGKAMGGGGGTAQATPSLSSVLSAECAFDNADTEGAARVFSRVLTKDHFGKMVVLGQFNLGFIIAKLGSDLFILDQHACDEKYNFETLQNSTVIHEQKLISPRPLELSAMEEVVVLDNLEVFRRNGFQFKCDEDARPMERLKLTSVPYSKGVQFGDEDIHELASLLGDNPGQMKRLPKLRSIFASRACRMSIMIGKALTRSQMIKVVRSLGQIEQPWNCPHGRPTMRHLVDLNRVG